MLGSATRTEAPAVGECCRACCGARRSNVGFKILLAVSLVLVLITWRLLMSNADQHVSLTVAPGCLVSHSKFIKFTKRLL